MWPPSGQVWESTQAGSGTSTPGAIVRSQKLVGRAACPDRKGSDDGDPRPLTPAVQPQVPHLWSIQHVAHDQEVILVTKARCHDGDKGSMQGALPSQ